jgi:hypothetical protein
MYPGVRVICGFRINCASLQGDISAYFILGFIMSTQNSLEILLAWLKGNVEMETDIIFADDIDSAAMIPAVQSAIAGLKFDVFNDEVSNLLKVKHKQVVKDALDASSDFLDADCVMDRLGISYSDAELRTSGALELHNALLGWASE